MSNFEEFTSDLYSVGLIGLQLYHLESNIKDDVYSGGHTHYYNSRINQENLQMLSFMVEGQPLKDWISTLLNQEPNRRLNIFEKIEGYQVDDRQVRELRANPLTVRAEEELVEPIRPVEENWQHNGIVHPVNTRPHVPVVVAGEVPNYG